MDLEIYYRIKFPNGEIDNKIYSRDSYESFLELKKTLEILNDSFQGEVVSVASYFGGYYSSGNPVHYNVDKESLHFFNCISYMKQFAKIPCPLTLEELVELSNCSKPSEVVDYLTSELGLDVPDKALDGRSLEEEVNRIWPGRFLYSSTIYRKDYFGELELREPERLKAGEIQKDEYKTLPKDLKERVENKISSTPESLEIIESVGVSTPGKLQELFEKELKNSVYSSCLISLQETKELDLGSFDLNTSSPLKDAWDLVEKVTILKEHCYSTEDIIDLLLDEVSTKSRGKVIDLLGDASSICSILHYRNPSKYKSLKSSRAIFRKSFEKYIKSISN